MTARRLTPGRWTFQAMAGRRRMRDDRPVMDALTGGRATRAGISRFDRRYRVAERRDLREAVRLGAMIGSVVLAVDLVMNAPDNPDLVVVNVVVNVVGIAALVMLFTRRARHHPQIAGFAVVVTLVWSSILPELVAPSQVTMLPGYLALIIVATALFLPWGARWHAAWLVMASVSGVAAGIMTSPTPEAALEFAVLVLAAAATSAAGNVLVRRRRDRVHVQQVALHEQRTELRRLSAQLREVASRDSLTGLGNRRRLTEDIADFEARLAREALPGVAAIMIDLDHFKAYNDRAGHPAGDEVLRVVSGAIRGAVREVDRVYRYGGEEMLVLLEEPTREGALLAAQRILDAVRRLALPHVAQPGHAVTVSAGTAAQAGPGVTVWHVIEAADQALYEAKRTGRDRAVLARPLPPATAPGPRARHVPADDEDADPGINPGPSPHVRLAV